MKKTALIAMTACKFYSSIMQSHFGEIFVSNWKQPAPPQSAFTLAPLRNVVSTFPGHLKKNALCYSQLNRTHWIWTVLYCAPRLAVSVTHIRKTAGKLMWIFVERTAFCIAFRPLDGVLFQFRLRAKHQWDNCLSKLMEQTTPRHSLSSG